ncbi:MAG: double-strand break repair helicase AddA [Rhodospirillales bacterium]|nr:double-strand break repair helicase AddA [Rhodospirillales bacterium]
MTDIPSPEIMTAINDASAAQALAAAPAASVWVGASAGSGKTKVLTDRVLALLLAGTKPHKILCLTFTKAAAAEMANRVYESLGAWAVADDGWLMAEIEKITGLGPHDDGFDKTMTLARSLFGAVLDCPGRIKIQTIHAFCESLLRRFPVEAGLQPHFQVMDDITAHEILGLAREEVLARATEQAEKAQPEDCALSDALAAIAGRVDAGSFQELMQTLAYDRGRIARLIETAGGLSGAVSQLSDVLKIDSSETEDVVVAAACTDDAFDGPVLRALTAQMTDGGKTDKDRSARMALFLGADVADRPAMMDDYIKGFINSKGGPHGRPFTKAVRDNADDPDALLQAFGVEAERLIAMRTRRRTARTFAGSRAALTLGAALIDAYTHHKQMRARLDYDDLILKTRALLESGVAWVLFKLDGGLDHILVDEAQDTSPDQWAVIQALADEFFAGTGARDVARTVFAVGDAKQSIYSFQRADPRAFEEMRNYFSSRVNAAGAPWRNVPLDVSFRSTTAVLDVVDAVFSGPAHDGVAPKETGITHRSARAGHGGRVEVWPTIGADTPSPQDPWAPALEPETVASAPTRLANTIAATIKGWITDGEMLESKNRAVRAGDIMILVRRRTSFVSDMVRALKRLDIPVAGADRMVLTEQLAVMDLMALGQFLLLPEDDLTLACVLTGPFIGFTQDTLFDLAYGRPGSLWQALRDRADDGGIWAQARDYLAGLLARTDQVRPFELFASILNENDGRARLLARLGREAEDPVNEFLELALSYERVAPPSLQGFLAWVEAGQSEIKRNLEQGVRNEVRIMTIHGAKGLQAPIVFLPDTMSKPNAPKAPLWTSLGDKGAQMVPLWAPSTGDYGPVLAQLRDGAIDEQNREQNRLLYVAMTRAEDRLIVCGWENMRKAPEGCWYDLVKQAMKAIPEGVETIKDPLDGIEGDGLRYQTPQIAEAKESEPIDLVAVHTKIEDWAKNNPGAETPVAAALSPSSLGDDPPTFSPAGNGGDRFLRGRLVHGLLQNLPEIDPRLREAVALRYLSRPLFGLDDATQKEIAAETLAVLNDPAFGLIFAPGSLAEVPVAGTVTGAGGDVVISGQIDRLVVLDDAVLIVDYKTGRPIPDHPDKVAPAYLRQMALYRAALTQIFPSHTIRCALVYTAAPVLIELAKDGLEQALAGIQRKA